MMDSREIVPDDFMMQALQFWGFKDYKPEEGRLLLTELLVKANAGSCNSYSEDGFMEYFGMLRKNRTLNKLGSKFIESMLYKHSNNKSDFVSLSNEYRK